MSTPVENAVLASYLADLKEKELSDELIEAMELSFLAEKLPSPEAMAELIKRYSGDTIA